MKQRFFIIKGVVMKEYTARIIIIIFLFAIGVVTVLLQYL